MNREDIIRWAREAGYPDYVMGLCSEEGWQKTERFASLVAAAEREACAKLCETIATETYGMTNLREYGECADEIRARRQA